MSNMPAKEFDGNVSGLTRHLFFDSIIIALTSFIIGLPAVSTIYGYFSSILGDSRVKCYPPSNISASKALDIEYFCLSHYTVYATFYPAMATFFGATIAVIFYIWINHHSSKFDLFFWLAERIEKSTELNQKKTLMFVKKIQHVFVGSECMHKSYIVMKFFQAFFALVALITTILLLYVSPPFDHSSLFRYDIIFYCRVNQFDDITSPLLSPNEQVPCTSTTLHITVAILYYNFVFLLFVFVCSILSMFPKLFPTLNHKQFEHEKAADYSFHTGLSPRFYRSKVSLADRIKIYSDYDFLMVFLLRTDAGRANKVWEAQISNEIELSVGKDLMNSIKNYRQHCVEGVTATGQPENLFPKDLCITGLYEVLKRNKPGDELKDTEFLQLELPRSFRGAVIGYCSAVAGKKSKAVFISVDPKSLGIPLALSFVIENICVLTFDPSCTVEGTEDGDLCKKKEYINFQQFIIPFDILVSKRDKLDTITKPIMTDADCIVCGPVEDETAQNTMLSDVLEMMMKAAKLQCILLAITPGKMTFHKKKFFEITPLIQATCKWSRLSVDKGNKDDDPSVKWKWPGRKTRNLLQQQPQQQLQQPQQPQPLQPLLPVCVPPPAPQPDPQDYRTLDGMFTFDLYYHKGN